MTGIKFDSQRGSHVLSRVSLREDVGILKVLSQKRKSLAAAQKKLAQSKKNKGKKGNASVTQANLNGSRIYARVSRRSFGNGSMKPERTLATAPKASVSAC